MEELRPAPTAHCRVGPITNVNWPAHAIRAVISAMALAQKCPNCGYELTDLSAPNCPVCGKPTLLLPTNLLPMKGSPWVGAIVPIVFGSAFVLILGLPHFMIWGFVAIGLIGGLTGTFVKPQPRIQAPAPQRPVARPALLGLTTVGIAICSLALVCIFFLGLPMFLNSWTQWHQYEGQSYYRAEFQVTRAFYQRQRGGPSVYASGIVEGNREWMSLRPYLGTTPHSQAELDARVPSGTIIPIYLFPGMKGRLRVRALSEGLPAEPAHQMAIEVAKYGSLGFAVSAGLLFLLTRIRKTCFAEEPVGVGVA